MMALLTPAILLMLGHGIVSAGLFFCVGCLYERTHTRDLNLLASGAAVLPKLSFYFLLFILGNIAFPGTVNFIAEFAILKGLLHYDPLVVLLIMPSYVANAAFNIWLVTRVLYGSISKLKTIIHPEDLTFRELVILRNLCFFMIGLGTIFADPIISQIERGLALDIPLSICDNFCEEINTLTLPNVLLTTRIEPSAYILSLTQDMFPILRPLVYLPQTTSQCINVLNFDIPIILQLSHKLGFDVLIQTMHTSNSLYNHVDIAYNAGLKY